MDNKRHKIGEKYLFRSFFFFFPFVYATSSTSIIDTIVETIFSQNILSCRIFRGRRKLQNKSIRIELRRTREISEDTRNTIDRDPRRRRIKASVRTQVRRKRRASRARDFVLILARRKTGRGREGGLSVNATLIA